MSSIVGQIRVLHNFPWDEFLPWWARLIWVVETTAQVCGSSKFLYLDYMIFIPLQRLLSLNFTNQIPMNIRMHQRLTDNHRNTTFQWFYWIVSNLFIGLEPKSHNSCDYCLGSDDHCLPGRYPTIPNNFNFSFFLWIHYHHWRSCIIYLQTTTINHFCIACLLAWQVITSRIIN